MTTREALPVTGVAGRVALVTGAGQGIGAAIACRLAREGALVAVNALHEEKAGRTAAALLAEGGRALPVPGDVARLDDVHQILSRVQAELGPVDILVNNAATLTMAPFLKLDPVGWDRTLAVNLSGPIAITARVLPSMLARGWGRVVSVASIWGITPARGAVAYSASKGGLIGFTRALAAEIGAGGVVATAIAPGIVDTPQLQADAGFAGITLEEMRLRYAKDALLERISSPAEIAGVVAFLSSDGAAAFHGQTLSVTGGRCE